MTALDVSRSLTLCFFIHWAVGGQINYRLSQPQIYIDDGHIYLVPAEHRNLVLVANGTGKILFNDLELNTLVTSVKNSSNDLAAFKKIFGAPTNASAGVSQRISSLEETMSKLNLVESLDVRITNIERQVAYNSSSSESEDSRRSNSINGRLRRLRNRIETLENRFRGMGSATDNPCSSNPCSNGGTCIPTVFGAFCWCRDGWEGQTCQQDVNECANFLGTDLGCQNGASCINRPGSYECQCRSNWVGIHCTKRSGDCSSAPAWELCGHGVCVSQHVGSRPYTCICEQGWKTDGINPACTVDVDECTSGHPSCSANPPVACINTPGSYVCGPCPSGYTGNGHRCTDLNECLMNNGGCSVNPMVQCVNTPGSRTCGECPPGYIGNGIMCQYMGMCYSNNGGCHPMARCVENPMIGQSFVQCMCPAGYTGTGMGLHGCFPYQTIPGSDVGPPISNNPCFSNPCTNGGRCQAHGNAFTCACLGGYAGPTCAMRMDPCQASPCQNQGTCVRTSSETGFMCRCTEDFTGDFCEQQVESCGGVLTTMEGTLRYPHDTSQSTYQNNVNCAWVIRTVPGKVLDINFTRFHLEGEPGCAYDSLEIRDGAILSAPLMGKFCGEIPPRGGNFVSTHNALYFSFKSDHSTVGLGFEFTWNTTEPVCGGMIVNQTHGSISSPGYPENYPHDRDCIWSISVNPGKRIQLLFATLRIESHPNCSYDYIEVRDGLEDNSRVIDMFCNTTLPPPLVSSGPVVSLRFHSDSSQSDVGFHVTFAEAPGTGIPGCGGVLTNPSGAFSSPQHPEPHPHGLECEWLIRLPSVDDQISLKFTTFELEGSGSCIYDYVEIRDGNLPSSALVGRFCGHSIPPDFSSSSSQLYVKFHSDESVAHGGFAVKYEAVCGGVLSAPEGVIRSPYYPNNYPKNRECIYLVSQPAGKGILVDFQDFDVESGIDTRCLFDFLEARDGDTENSTLIGHYCGPPAAAPERIVSSYNYLWFKFKTDGSLQNRGFLANYSTYDTGCGGILRESHGIISSPGHPEVYPHGVTCTWVIRGVPGQIVRLSWVTFTLEQGTTCSFDYVQVFDNSTMFRNGSSIGKYCGQNTPPALISSDNTMTIVFKSDHSVSQDGFMANYVLLNSSTVCGGEYFTDYGVIRSPKFPDPYPNRKTCVWIIKVAVGKQIKLNFTDFEMENGTSTRYDHYTKNGILFYRNGALQTSPLIGKFCGNVLPPSIIPSFSNTMYVKFNSDLSRSYRGFQAIWDGTTTGCGGTIKSPTGSVMSPNYPLAYGSRTECVWVIEVNQGSQIQVVFADLDIQQSRSCWGEHIEIRDGNDRRAPLIGKYCHADSILMLNSTGNSLWIKFLSGFGASGRGFHLNYQASCNKVITGFHGVIESPNFPNPYPHNRNCTWEIQAPRGNKVNVSFSHFSIEQARRNNCIYDFVELKEWKRSHGPDPSKSLGKFCGENRPGLIASSLDTVSINFISDHSYALNGFRLEWRVNGCGGRIIKNWGRLQSPNYPLKYSNDVECLWHVTTELGTKVELHIYTLDIERQEDCYFDGLKVYGGPDESSPMLLSLCHTSQSSTVVTSHGNNMFIKFYSDGSYPAQGFMAEVYSTPGGCGGRYKASSGFIYSPNYPLHYDHNDDCGWLIEVDQNHVVQLQFTDFAVERHINCSYDHVAIYDGQSSDDPLLLLHCGNQLPDPAVIRSTGNKMFLRLKTDGSSASKGFKANYTTGCGARITGSDSGVITSPNYPGYVPFGLNCTWIIIAPTLEDHVTLTFTALGLASEDGCESNSVEILDGEDSEAPAVGKFCANQIPPSITSRGNALVIRLNTSLFFGGGYGFRAVYDHSSGACGGRLTSVNGSFTSPNYPVGYPANVECIWIIEASVGNKVELSFRRFEIEQSDNCNTDFVEIHEDSASGPLLGHFCGNAIPGNLTAARRLWVLFRTDSEGQAAGFWADFNLVHGVELSGSYGEIASPDYPIENSVTGTFYWRVTVNQSKAIEISFEVFDFEDYGMGNCDGIAHMEIFDGYDTDAPILMYQCTTPKPNPLTSTGNVVYIEHYKPWWGTGFKLSWREVQPPNGLDAQGFRINVTGCGGNFSIIEGNTTSLFSPFYPFNYPNSIRCVWGIDAPLHTRVKLTVMDLDLEQHPSCQYDKVEVYDGREGLPNYRLNQTLCLRSQINTSLISSGRFLQLILQTDTDTPKPGFNFSLTAVCGGYLREPQGVITTPGYPNNYVTSDCEWFIIVLPGRTIKLTFNTFDIYGEGGGNCVTDDLIIRNGATAESPFLGAGRFCGSSIANLPESSGNHLYLRFRASTHSRRGFSLFYTEVAAGCGGEIYLTDQSKTTILQSPNFPQTPPPFTECEWFISAPQGESVQLTFQISFQIFSSSGCQDAGVQLRDGGTILSPEINTFCRDMPGTQKTTGNIMYVRYYTNVPEPRGGFKAEVKIATCGGVVTGSSGTIQSPGYPNPYEPNLDCLWTIKGPQTGVLILNFVEIDIPNVNGSCVQDTIIVTEKNVTGIRNPRNWTVCNDGSTTDIRRIEASTNQIRIKFTSDGTRKTRKGFKLSYRIRIENCGGSLRSPTGIIQSPGYPVAYPHYRHCSWRIFAPEGRRVRLEFLDFDMEETYFNDGKRVCYDAVTIYQGQWRDLPPLYNRSLCGPSLPSPVETYSESMTIYFGTDGSVAHRGFKARYTTDLPAICGGTIASPNGVLTSPNMTTGTPNTTTNVYCDWKSIGDSNNGTTIVTINRLLIPPWGRKEPFCPQGILRISPSAVTYNFAWKTYCGSLNNVKVYIPGSGIRVEYETGFVESSFNISYRVAPCGGSLFGPQDNITSLNFPSAYPVDTECIWILEYDRASQIKIRFLDLDLDDHQGSEGCDRDYVIIRNGKYQSSPALGKYCGSNLPPDIISMSSHLWIEFHSDENSNGNKRGFKISTEVVARGCGGVVHKKFGKLTSPEIQGSSRYPPNTECEWIIESVPGYVVNLLFYGRFDIEQTPNCTNDVVEIFSMSGTSEWKPVGRYCGRQVPAGINTTSTSVKVRFRTNGAVDGDGFSLAWFSPCGGVFTDSTGIIRSAHYDRYNHSHSLNFENFWSYMGWESTWLVKRCDYIVQGRPEDFIVVEFLPPFEVLIPSSLAAFGSSDEDIRQECPTVNLTLWQGNSTSRSHSSQIYCGTEPPPSFVGRGQVTISYNYKAYYQNAGFRARYSVFRCGGEITQPSRISSPGHPFSSAPQMNCTWTVKAPPNRVVRFKLESLELEFHTRCSFDSVQVFDGPLISDEKRLATYCGNMTQDMHRLSSKSNFMTVQFTTDWSVQYGGFQASVDFTIGPVQGCGGLQNVTGGTKTIQSADMDSDGKYEAYLDCQWVIVGPAYQALQITFETFNLEGGARVLGKNSSALDPLSPCLYDFIEIRDGPGPNGQLLGIFCGTSIPPSLSSSQNFMWIRFVSDGSYNFPGFRARMASRESPCGGSFVLNATKQVQTLTSPGYPTNYAGNVRCKWTMDGGGFVDEVDIKFIDMDIASSPACVNDRLEIKDVTSSYTSPEGIGGPILFTGNGPTNWRFNLANLNLDAATIFQDVRYCGIETPPDFFSVGRSAELVFHTDGTGSGRGFKIEYKAAGCNRTYEGLQGRIFSPEWPTHSPLFLSCQFTILAPNGSFISLYFNQFLLPGIPQDQYASAECTESAFEVRDGSASGPILGKFCSSSRPNPVFSLTNILWVNYFTRLQLSRGYDITYSTTNAARGCGGDIFHTGGSFTSPMYPGNYSKEMDCRWRIRVPAGLRIQIEFTTFMIGGDCSRDFVEVLSANAHEIYAAPVLFSRFCPGDTPSLYSGSTDMAIVRYKTSINNTGTGWRAEFKGVIPTQLPS